MNATQGQLAAVLAGDADVPTDPDLLADLIDAASMSQFLTLFGLFEPQVNDSEVSATIWDAAQQIVADRRGVTR